ncbi:TlyA family RNA methyltransferase [Candidatus Saccharibacteria bacterium]|nr:TlyA family RNA methyltransferase [Candidatus Saccharibacteria bacterium]
MHTVNVENNYVSRAENKLAGAAQAFSFDFRGKTVLDIGSSTGGFTEYALSRGAKKVVAVEKGTRQMKAPLKFDPRVELHEKTDIFEFETGEKIDVILADVSFVSLTKVLAYAKKTLANETTEWLVMLKPQFEARPDQLVRGVVKNEKMRREIIKDFEAWLRENGFLVRGKRDNQLAGKNGNVERFYDLLLAKK